MVFNYLTVPQVSLSVWNSQYTDINNGDRPDCGCSLLPGGGHHDGEDVLIGLEFDNMSLNMDMKVTKTTSATYH